MRTLIVELEDPDILDYQVGHIVDAITQFRGVKDCYESGRMGAWTLIPTGRTQEIERVSTPSKRVDYPSAGQQG